MSSGHILTGNTLLCAEGAYEPNVQPPSGTLALWGLSSDSAIKHITCTECLERAITIHKNSLHSLRLRWIEVETPKVVADQEGGA